MDDATLERLRVAEELSAVPGQVPCSHPHGNDERPHSNELNGPCPECGAAV